MGFSNNNLVGGAISPSWKMMEWKWAEKDDIPYMKWKIQNVWNHQPVWDLLPSKRTVCWKIIIFKFGKSTIAMAMVSIALNPETGDVMGFLLGYKKPEKPRKMGFNIGLYIYI